MMKRHLVAIVFIFFMCSCASKYYLITSKYQGRKINNASLLVILTDEPIIDNRDDVIDDLGPGVPEDVYLNFMKENLVKYLKTYSSFKDVEMNIMINPIPVIEDTKDFFNEERIKITVPEYYPVQLDSGKTPDFILLIQKLKTSREVASYSMSFGNPPMSGYRSGPHLVQSGDYTIWDNKTGQIVSFGKFGAQVTYFLVVTKSTWDSGLISIAKQISKGSPFYEPPRR